MSSKRTAQVVRILLLASALFFVTPVIAQAATYSSSNTGHGTVSGLTPTPKPGYLFEGWYRNGTKVTSDISGQPTDSSSFYTAHFTRDCALRVLAGTGRYDTMKAIVDFGSFESSGTVVLATGAAFPDALTASALAGTASAPIVLTEPNKLSPQASAELKALKPKEVIVLGGSGAVSDKVYSTVASTVPAAKLTRIGGQNRESTANLIYTSNKLGWGRTAVVATGQTFPDALSIAPFTYLAHAPIFLTTEDGTLTDAAMKHLNPKSFDRVIIVGGTGVVSQRTQNSLAGTFGASAVIRLAGTSRYETSLAISTWCVGSEGMSLDNMAVATGEDYPDALSGAALQGKSNAILLLAAPSDFHPVVDFTVKHAKDIKRVRIFGGTGVVPPHLKNQIKLGSRMPYPASMPTMWGTFTTQTDYYSLPATSSKLVGGAQAGTHIEYRSYDKKGTWGMATVGGQTVYFQSTSTRFKQAQVVKATPTKALKLLVLKPVAYFASPFTDSPSQGTFSKYQVIFAATYDSSRSWFTFTRAGRTYYIQNTSQALEILPEKTATDNTLRAGRVTGTKKFYDAPSANAKVVGTWSANQIVWSRLWTADSKWLYAVKNDGSVVYFDRSNFQINIVTVTKNPELNKKLEGILDRCTTPSMTQSQKLSACYRYVVNSYSYKTIKGPLPSNWVEKYALDMINTGKGNCYSNAALFHLLAKSLGYNSTPITGGVALRVGGTAPHGWVEIKINGTTYICDPEAERATKRNAYMVTYKNSYWTYVK